MPALVGLAMHKRAILFDIDGTLIDSNDAHVEAWQRALAAEGHMFTRTQIHAQIGKGGDNLVPSLLPGASNDEIARLSRVEGEIYKRDYMPGVVPFDGAKQALRRLAEIGHTLVLASSASREEVEYYVDLLDAQGLLTGTTSKDDVGASKPCADIFVAALELTGGPPSDAVVVGDTPYDIVAARRATIEAIALLSGGFERDEFAACRPLEIYDNIQELDSDYASSPLSTDPRLVGSYAAADSVGVDG